MHRSKKRLAFILILILTMFLGLVFYLIFFQLSKSKALRSHPANSRNWVDERRFGRGLFLDRNGYELTIRSQDENGIYHRKNKHKNMYAHIIGYNSPSYGKSGLEKSLNQELLNLSENPISQLRGQILSKGLGNNIKLSIDNDYQYLAYSVMEGHKGAAIIMDPNSGSILAMVSMPSFDLENLDENWAQLVEDPDKALFPRAYKGLYTPGSVIKPITALALLENGLDLSYDDKGQSKVEGYNYSNYDNKAYGHIGLKEALEYSSNVFFVDKTKDMDPDELAKACQEYGLGRDIDFPLPSSKSKIPYKKGMDLNAKVSAAFGQGDFLVSPLEMATAYSAIANGGRLMKPNILDSVIYPDGEVKKKIEPEILNSIKGEYIKKIREGLEAAAVYNGLNASLGYKAACKTGTAQIAGDSTNAWTIAYSPADKPKYLVCLVLEDDGRSGAEAAMPLLAKILKNLD